MAHNVRLVARAIRDFVDGFRTFRKLGPCVTVFGSARTRTDNPHYEMARRLGRSLAERGFTVVTGGGPGIMEAANRGAHEAGGESIGCNIRLPAEQAGNKYVSRSMTCRQFFVRKVLLFRYSVAFVALPGGFGTLDELFEALTLVQNRKIDRVPIVLIGSAYWLPLVAMLEQMAQHGTIDRSDLDLILLTDDVDVAIAHIGGDAASAATGVREDGGTPASVRTRWIRPATARRASRVIRPSMSRSPSPLRRRVPG
jgi:uncharacterized protein (TIGR00730 family)